MMKGRKPVPTALKLINGTQRKDRAVNEAKVDKLRLKAPLRMTPGGRKAWRHIVPMLQAAGLAHIPDEIGLRMLCEWHAVWLNAMVKAQDGLLVRAANNTPMVSPYIDVAKKASDQVGRLLVEFGMTPSSRSRIDVGLPKMSLGDAPSDVASKYFSTAKGKR